MSTDERQQTCAQRIQGHKASRIGDFRELLNAYANATDDAIDEAQERISEYPLWISTHRVWRIDISTGGPGDWLEIHTDQEGDPTRAEYHFNDWFDHASTVLEGEDYDTAVEFASMVTADFYTEDKP